jgi:zinc transport system ATP-binding protein
MSTVVQVRAGAVAYGDREVLRGVNLTVHQGEVVAILGANGSGKSTLIRAVLGLVPFAAGDVSLFGVAAQGRAMRRSYRRIGYVPQRLGAGSGVPATVTEVVSSGRLARRALLRPAGAVDRTAVAEAIAAVGLTNRADAPVSTLSGGQQQRVLIATAGVDALSQVAFVGALRAFIAHKGTVLLVAHELGPLASLVTRAIVVHDGIIAHDGPVPEPAGHHADPHHDHVHPHAPPDHSGIWDAR